MSKKKGKVVSWVVIDLKSGIASALRTREDARGFKMFKNEKIIKVEVVDGQPTAKFVR